MVQPTAVTGALPNGVYYAWSKENRILALDFTYRPPETKTSYIVARVHITPPMAKYLREAVEKFLKDISEKK
jgi:hypothetical protein